jgi:tyrosinase
MLMIIRKNAKDLTAAEKTAFTDAIIALKKLPSRLHPTDKKRGRYDDFVEVHLNAMNAMMMGHVPNWGHLSAAFGPWHRVLLYHFESELRALKPGVALPFWDWTDAASTKAIFAADFLGGNGRSSDGQVTDGPFAHAKGNWTVVVKDDPSNEDFLVRQLGADPSASTLPDKKRDQDPVMALKVYDEAPWYDNQRTTAAQRTRVDDLFRFRLEYDLHNLIHRYVGGHMVLAASPNDPVFWLHHCNIDRLWSLWEQTTGKEVPYAPLTGGPAGQSGDKSLIFSFKNGQKPWLGSTRPKDVLDSRAQLQIGYSTDVAEAAILEDLPPMQPMMHPMPAKEMYPLRKEFHRKSPHAMKMFPLRHEFKGKE